MYVRKECMSGRNVRNVCRFEAAAWGRGALRDSGPSGCEGDKGLLGFEIG